MSESGRNNTQQQNNNTFLSNLRASNIEIDSSNEETIGRSNTAKYQQNQGSLIGLFDPPPTTGDVQKDTVMKQYANREPHTPETVEGTYPDAHNDKSVSAANGLPPLRPKLEIGTPKLEETRNPAYTALRGLPSMRANPNLPRPGDFFSVDNTEASISNGKEPIIRRVPQVASKSDPQSPGGLNLAGHTIAVPARPQRAKHHQRAVSWGLLDSPPPPHENVIGDDISSFGNRSMLEQPSLERTVTGGSRAHNRSRILTLDDVLRASPLEQEAETSILKALDELHATARRPRANTGTSSSIPDNLSHDFSLEDEDGEAYEVVEGTDEMLHNCSSQEADSRGGSVGSGNPRKSPLAIKKMKLHRRGVSVEQRLLGLTLTLAMQDKEEEQEEWNHQPVPETISTGYSRINATDELAQNSQLMSKSALQGWLDSEPTSMVGPTTPNPRILSTVLESDEHHDRQDTETSQHGDDHERRKHNMKMRMVQLYYSNTKKMKNARFFAFCQSKRQAVYTYAKFVLFYLMFPVLAVAAILFYGFNNPPTGKNNDGDLASASWWLIFVGVRQVITFSSALGLQGLVIDYFALSTKLMLRVCGPVMTLFIVQSKGWPFVLFTWGAIDFCTLNGPGPFAAHWAFWQQMIDLFNATNPSGHVVDSPWNRQVLTIAVSLSAATSCKRFLVTVFLGRQTFVNYGPRLAKLMQKMFWLRHVAKHAKDIETRHFEFINKAEGSVQVSDSRGGELSASLHGLVYASLRESMEQGYNGKSNRSLDDTGGTKTVNDLNDKDSLTDNMQQAEQNKLIQLLEQWEEPELSGPQSANERTTISAVLRFRRALAFLRTEYPFSFAFGPADTRENCIDSAEKVYNHLMLPTPNEEVLHFETIIVLAQDESGELDEEKAKELLKLFRPDRKGLLTRLDFAKSVDAVYKAFRILLASIDNSSKIDKAFENILNVIFYVIACTIILSQIGIDPLALFLSLSSVILAFAFAIGSASAKFFEGLLFILLRRPYNVGDRIHVSNVEADTSIEGSRGWVVQNITLFETTAVMAGTKEWCSLSNASLAYSRIINGARSPQAQIWIFLKFPIDSPYDKIQIFKSAIEEYLKARPREWLSLNFILAQEIVPDHAFVKYAVVAQHRNSWQEIGQLLTSKAELSSYCHEVQKQLGMNYHAPPLPVHLNQMNQQATAAAEAS